MLKKLITVGVLIGTALASGSSVSARDLAVDGAPEPPPVRAPIDDVAAPERPDVTGYIVYCYSSTACASLRVWCDKNDGSFHEFGSGKRGVCSG